MRLFNWSEVFWLFILFTSGFLRYDIKKPSRELNGLIKFPENLNDFDYVALKIENVKELVFLFIFHKNRNSFQVYK